MTQRFLANPPMPDIDAQWRYYFSLLDCRPGDCVLDVGCDTADAVHLLAELCPAAGRLIGLNYSLPPLADALTLWISRGRPPSVRFLLGDGQTLPFADHSLNRIYCADTLEWIPSPLLALKEMRRVLTPDGLALLIHTDFDMQAFEGPDSILTREIIHRFTDSGPDGTIGRRLGILARQAGLRHVETQVYTLVNERYEPESYAYHIAGLMTRWLRELMPAETLREWRESLAVAAAEGRFWYSVNRNICVCRV